MIATESTVSSQSQPPRPTSKRDEADRLLQGLFSSATTSTNLFTHQHPVIVQGSEYSIPRVMLLGQRGGERPIRIAIFGGLDAGSLESVAAEARLLTEIEAQPGLARDFALFAYPIVNVLGFTSEATPLHAFEARFGSERLYADVEFFKAELRNWVFDGLISLRTDAEATGFYASVRSDVIAKEVVGPALASLAAKYPVREHPVRLRRSDRYARLSDYTQGRLAPLADVRPYPFEIELFAPGKADPEVKITGFVAAVHQLLRHYRECMAHAPNL
jgi:hypothetical protein